MPGGDGTGPMGMGPMTGRAAGYCAGFAVPGSMTSPGGQGFGGRRGGRGRRNWFYATGLTGWQRAASGQPAFGRNQPQTGLYSGPFASPAMGPDQEVELLKQQVRSLGNTLDQIKRRLEELQAQPEAQPR